MRLRPRPTYRLDFGYKGAEVKLKLEATQTRYVLHNKVMHYKSGLHEGPADFCKRIADKLEAVLEVQIICTFVRIEDINPN